MDLHECSAFIKSRLSKHYTILLQNGVILESTIDEDALLKLIPIVQQISHKIPIGHMIQTSPLVLFHITDTLFLIFLSKKNEAILIPILAEFMLRYGGELSIQYQIPPKNVGNLIKYAIFAVNRQVGPEPVAFVVNEGKPPLTEDRLWKLGITGMMTLINEVEGAKTRVLTFHPFIESGELGAIFLFQIPFAQARGGAFDAALILVLDYEDRALIYENHAQMERYLSNLADKCVNFFHKHMINDIHASIENREELNGYLSELLKKLRHLKIAMRNTSNLEKSMIESLQDLNAILFYDS
jgi:hypothetical protein